MICREWRKLPLWLPVLLLAVSQSNCRAEEPWTFVLKLDPQVRQEPFTGQVTLFFSAQTTEPGAVPEPRQGPNWFAPQPLLSVDVKGWSAATPVTMTLDSEGVRRFPLTLKSEDLAGRVVQAVARFNPDDPVVGSGVGNGYSSSLFLMEPGKVELTISEVVPPEKFPADAWSKLLRIRSDRLSKFHGKDVYLQGSVTVPASYHTETRRKYPVILEVPGFGGNHFYKLAKTPPEETNTLGVEFIRVMLDPRCPTGHHVFANSDNNGPYTDALLHEFIPELDRAYRTAGGAGRFLTGHSSGGWSTLWLQLTSPDHFAGTWSTAPDSVDFRDFQKINIYQADANAFVDGDGNPRPLARVRGIPVLDIETFSRMEDVLGAGGQLCSFDAVFGPRLSNGLPAQLWNHQTGAIDPEIARSWERYDLRLLVEKNWPTRGPKVQGKIHVFMGAEDTFYLEGATILLKESLEKLGSDAVIEIIPGRDHRTVVDSILRNRIQQEMAEKFLAGQDPSLQDAR